MNPPALPRALDDDKVSFEGELQAEASLKPEYNVNVKPGEPQCGVRSTSPDPSLVSIDDFSQTRIGRQPNNLPGDNGRRINSRSPAPARTIATRIQQGWATNKGLFLVIISQFFGSLMNVLTRILEMEGNDGTI